MSNHSFNPLLAKKFGITEAVIINSLIFWTQTNAAKETNFHQDRYWCFGTPEYFTKFFIYLSARQIKYALSNLIKAGALLKNNFNKKGYDKTSWYSLSDELLTDLNLDRTCLQPAPVLIEQNCPIDRTKLSYASDKIVPAIPVTKTITKKDITTTTEEPSTPTPVVVVNINSKTLTDHEKKKLIQTFENHPIESDNIKTIDGFLNAALYSIINREEGITRQQRLHGIIKLMKNGLFEEPPLWVKEQNKTKSKIPETKEEYEARIKRYMQENKW